MRPFPGDAKKTKVGAHGYVPLLGALCAYVVLLGAFSLLAISCARGPNQISRGEDEKATYMDEVGRRVAIRANPERIVSMAPSVTETLFALGLEDRLVGVTDYCDHPEGAKLKPRIGGLINPNYEIIVSLKPDLAIATTSGNRRESVDKLAELGISVYTVNATSVEGTLASILHIGEIAGKRREAEALVSNLRRRLNLVKEKVQGLPPKRVLYLIWHDPIIAPGCGSFINDALKHAGADSVTADAPERSPRYSLEQIIAKRPEYILIPKGEARVPADLAKLPGWKSIPAVKHKRIYFVTEAIQHPSPRLVDGIEEAARILYPERF